MITSAGRDIIAKYLIGQTNTYASHIAIGCGTSPTASLGDYTTKSELTFEMDRFPIQSFGQIAEPVTVYASAVQAINGTFVITITGANTFYAGQSILISDGPSFTNQTLPTNTPFSINGSAVIQSITGSKITILDLSSEGCLPETKITSFSVKGYAKKIVVTAELPVNNRYEITELGLYSMGFDPTITGSASKTITNFTQDENWKYVTNTATYTDIPYYSSITDSTNSITVTNFYSTAKVFQTNSNNPFFNYVATDSAGFTRITRQERPRFLEDTIIVGGNLSEFSANLTPTTSAPISEYITLSNLNLDLSKNSSNDEIRIAYSLINAIQTPTTTPKSINIMLQFITADGNDSAKYHFRDTDTTSLISGTTGAYVNNRYRTKALALNAATYTSSTTNFDWKNVTSLRIYASVENAADYTGTALTDYAIALDAIRFENKSSNNSKYALVGYNIVRTTSGIPLIKEANTNNLVEFRFILGVTSYV